MLTDQIRRRSVRHVLLQVRLNDSRHLVADTSSPICIGLCFHSLSMTLILIACRHSRPPPTSLVLVQHVLVQQACATALPHPSRTAPQPARHSALHAHGTSSTAQPSSPPSRR